MGDRKSINNQLKMIETPPFVFRFLSITFEIGVRTKVDVTSVPGNIANSYYIIDLTDIIGLIVYICR